MKGLYTVMNSTNRNDINIKNTTVSKLTYSDNILFVEMKEGAILDRATIKEQVDARNELVGEKPFATLVDARNKHKVTSEARNPDEKLDEPNRIAMAIVTNNLVTRTAANFFFQIKRPKVPMKMFSKREDAIDWLEVQIRKWEYHNREAS